MKKSLAAVVLMLSFGLAWAADGPDSNGPLSGKVLEVKDVDSYTYLLLQTVDGEVWAAVGKVPAKVGDEVTIEDAALMPQFFSKSLNRTFDRIYFGSVVTGGSGTAGAGTAGAGADMAAMHAAAARSTEIAEVNVARATGPNAHTVAEVVSGRATLNDKPVMVRGKVVKFTPTCWARTGSTCATDRGLPPMAPTTCS